VAETIAELVKEQKEFRKRLEAYKNSFIRFNDLERMEKKILELDARIAKLEK